MIETILCPECNRYVDVNDVSKLKACPKCGEPFSINWLGAGGDFT